MCVCVCVCVCARVCACARVCVCVCVYETFPYQSSMLKNFYFCESFVFHSINFVVINVFYCLRTKSTESMCVSLLHFQSVISFFLHSPTCSVPHECRLHLSRECKQNKARMLSFRLAKVLKQVLNPFPHHLFPRVLLRL